MWPGTAGKTSNPVSGKYPFMCVCSLGPECFLFYPNQTARERHACKNVPTARPGKGAGGSLNRKGPRKKRANDSARSASWRRSLL